MRAIEVLWSEVLDLMLVYHQLCHFFSMSFFSRDSTLQPQSKRKSHAPAFGPGATRLLTDRPDVYNWNMPRNFVLADLARAISSQYPQIASKLQLYTEGDQIRMQVFGGEEILDLCSKGVLVKNTVFKPAAMFNSLHGDIIEVTMFGLKGTDSDKVQKQVADALGDVFTIMGVRLGLFEGSALVSGEASCMMMTPSDRVTETHYQQKFDHWTNQFKVVVRSHEHFCHFCRKRSHLRKDCTIAPPCSKCQSRAHPTFQCSRKIANLRKDDERLDGTTGQQQTADIRAGKKRKPDAPQDEVDRVGNQHDNIPPATTTAPTPASGHQHQQLDQLGVSRHISSGEASTRQAVSNVPMDEG